MTFKITSALKPYEFADTSECAISYVTFGELIDAHYANKIPERGIEARKTLSERLCEAVYRIIDLYIGELAPYFVALVEDESKNCALYDLREIHTWFKIGSFTNPNSRATVTKVHFYAISRTCEVNQFGAVDTLSKFKNTYMLIEDPRITSTFEELPLALCAQGESIAWNWWNFVGKKNLPVTNMFFLQRLLGPKTSEEIDAILQKYDNLNFNAQVHHDLAGFYSVRCFERMDTRRSVYHLEKAIELQHPQRKKEYITLADLYIELGRFELVDAVLNKLREMTDNPGQLYTNIGREYLRRGHHIEALKYLKTARELIQRDELSKDSVSLQCHQLLAEAYMQLGDFAMADLYLSWVNIERLPRVCFGVAEFLVTKAEVHLKCSQFASFAECLYAAWAWNNLGKSVETTMMLRKILKKFFLTITAFPENSGEKCTLDAAMVYDLVPSFSQKREGDHVFHF